MRATRNRPFDALLAFVEQEFEREAVVGGAVAIVLEGQLAWSTGLGLREMGGEEPVTPEYLVARQGVAVAQP